MRPDADTTQPRRAVASFSTYREAEQAVDRLADNKFPVERTAIVGRNLQMIEQVTGRMDWGRAALRGAATGAIVGFLVGWLFGIFDWADPIVSAFWLAIDGLWFGALVGALMGLVLYALTRGRRDFASVATMQAERYDVLVDEPVADEAARLLGADAQQQSTTPPPQASTNPVHGV